MHLVLFAQVVMTVQALIKQPIQLAHQDNVQKVKFVQLVLQHPLSVLQSLINHQHKQMPAKSALLASTAM